MALMCAHSRLVGSVDVQVCVFACMLIRASVHMFADRAWETESSGVDMCVDAGRRVCTLDPLPINLRQSRLLHLRGMSFGLLLSS